MNSTLYREPDDDAVAMRASDFEMKGKTGVFHSSINWKDSQLSISCVLF